MAFSIHRPRQAVGSVYILVYAYVFFTDFVGGDDASWSADPTLTAMVLCWFALSLAVKVSMVLDGFAELLNLTSFLAFMSIAFVYIPQPGPFSAIENFCYYLIFSGGPACDFFDFLYEAGAKPPEDEP